MANPSETISAKKLSVEPDDLQKSSRSKGKTSADSISNIFHNNNIPRLGLNQDMNTTKISSSLLSLSRPPLLPRSKSCPLVIVAPPTKGAVSLEAAMEHELKHGRRKLDPNMDKKKLRRTISNRLSAQRSRVKKAQYILDMEKMVEDLQDLISNITPEVESCKEKQKLLMLENDFLKKVLENKLLDSEIREKELEEKKLELQQLKELEEAARNHKQGSDSGQDLDVKQFRFLLQPYPSISFYQSRLEDSQYKYGSVKQTVPSNSELVLSGIKVEPADSEFHQIDEDQVRIKQQEQEDSNIDQYLNFDIINIDSSKD